ncbi:MAG: hypothetical protein HYR55_12655 [Acidobacteria bacterium]|nr:hypothetical protein [Acidobacteriota bacterium]MBI3656515.1 hypothetical protein [Acidobacteriota bacterium]
MPLARCPTLLAQLLGIGYEAQACEIAPEGQFRLNGRILQTSSHRVRCTNLSIRIL